MRNRLYILTGLPYSGKTTIRKALIKRFGFQVISIDEINDEREVGVDENIPVTQDEWNTTYSEAYERLKKYLFQGKNIIFDGGGLLFKKRETQRQIAKSLGVDSKLIYVNTSIEEIKERWQKNQTTKQRSHVPENLFKSALGMWEEPTGSEKPILYNSKMDLESWIQQNIELFNPKL